MEVIIRISFVISIFCFGLVNGQNYNVLDFGAEGNGQTDDSQAFVKAWEATCGGEGSIQTLIIPSNKTYLLQPIVFQGPCKSSSIQVQLDGVIVAPSSIESWQKSEIWISFLSVFGLMLVGSGSINGHGSSFWEKKLEISQRPTALHMDKCDNLKIDGITSIDSPKNHISIKACKIVAISNINLIAPEDSPNTDGIDISDSTNINVFDSTIQTGDDCIAINTGSISINITRINCGPGHGISVGSLGGDGSVEATVSDVQVSHCTFNNTKNGARIKTWMGGQGYARNISFENIALINAENPIIIDQQYANEGRRRPNEEGSSAVAISDVKFIGFNGTTSNVNAITLKCSATTHCKDIIIDGIDITTPQGDKPKVDCQNVEGKSNDTNLMNQCFNHLI